MSENGRKPVKKISASAAVLLTLKVEVQSLYNRIIISYNRKGHRAFAVFLLSIFVGKCRRAVSDMRCRSPPLHLDFTFQKFGLEDNTVKYAPRKVYIRESGGYVELSYTDFCRCRESDQTYMDKLFIPIQGCLLEVLREQYTDFYRDKERWRYLQNKIYYKFIGFVGELHITPTKRWTALKPKNCTVCGVEYVPCSAISKYCPECRKKIRKVRGTETKRRSRERNRQACIELSAKNDRLIWNSRKDVS
nr:hypothetical protein IL225_00006 [uncultured bacterium]